MSISYKDKVLLSTILNRLYPLIAIFKCHESFISIINRIAKKKKHTKRGMARLFEAYSGKWASACPFQLPAVDCVGSFNLISGPEFTHDADD